MLQTNATLSRVQAPGSGEGYDGPAVAGAEKWAGSSAAYLRERRQRQQVEKGIDVALDVVLLVDRDVVVDWRVGDVVTVVRDGESVPLVRAVRIVERPAITDDEIPDELVTVRLTLDTR